MGREYGLPFLIIYQIWLAYAELDDPWSTIFMLLFPLPWHFSIHTAKCKISGAL
jgi:hypothetical protein